MELYYLAYCDLTSCRTQGYVEGPISWLTVNDYANARAFEGEQREDLFYLIRKMDDVYIEHQAKKNKTKSPAKGKGKKGGKA